MPEATAKQANWTAPLCCKLLINPSTKRGASDFERKVFTRPSLRAWIPCQSGAVQLVLLHPGRQALPESKTTNKN